MADQSDQKGFLQKEGSVFTTQYTERQMKAFLITETELETLSMLNSESVVFVGLGTGLLGYAADSLIGAVSSAPRGSLKLTASFVFLAVVCYLLAAWRFWRRHTVSVSIKRESRTPSG